MRAYHRLRSLPLSCLPPTLEYLEGFWCPDYRPFPQPRLASMAMVPMVVPAFSSAKCERRSRLAGLSVAHRRLHQQCTAADPEGCQRGLHGYGLGARSPGVAGCRSAVPASGALHAGPTGRSGFLGGTPDMGSSHAVPWATGFFSSLCGPARQRAELSLSTQ